MHECTARTARTAGITSQPEDLIHHAILTLDEFVAQSGGDAVVLLDNAKAHDNIYRTFSGPGRACCVGCACCCTTRAQRARRPDGVSATPLGMPVDPAPLPLCGRPQRPVCALNLSWVRSGRGGGRAATNGRQQRGIQRQGHQHAGGGGS
eukprot:354526-Chlamydomonas_euryale.AAC.13